LLRRAFDTAAALQNEAGLEFVVAPMPTLDGHTIVRAGPRHTVTLYPFVDGRSRTGHEYRNSQERAAVMNLLVRLHGATGIARRTAGTEDFALPYRAGLDAAMAEIQVPWSGGPFAEPARQLLAPKIADVQSLLAIYDALVKKAGAARDAWVITHGEPKPSNVMTIEDEALLIDWDTALIAPPERDLWMVVTESGAERRLYTEATGHEVNDDVVTLYGLWWDLSEIAGYISWFRLPHVARADTETGWRSLNHYLELQEKWSILLR
jgi:spectinomycin phosphotransferase